MLVGLLRWQRRYINGGVSGFFQHGVRFRGVQFLVVVSFFRFDSVT